jgi:hypothetical protein
MLVDEGLHPLRDAGEAVGIEAGGVGSGEDEHCEEREEKPDSWLHGDMDIVA